MIDLPDYAHLTLGQVFAHLFAIAFGVALSGIGRAFASRTVLYTYLADWLAKWLGPALILVATAAIGQGVPPLFPGEPLVAVLFVPAVGAYVAAAVAAAARNFGLDLSALPFAENARLVFGVKAVHAGDPTTPAPPATTSGPPDRRG